MSLLLPLTSAETFIQLVGGLHGHFRDTWLTAAKKIKHKLISISGNPSGIYWHRDTCDVLKQEMQVAILNRVNTQI